MLSGTGHQYILPPWRAPRVWDYNVAAEIDAHFFYSGVPWDMVRDMDIPCGCNSLLDKCANLRAAQRCGWDQWNCVLASQVARNYTAQTLNLATGKSLTQYDVIAVSAMEAVGVAPAINLHNQISGKH